MSLNNNISLINLDSQFNPFYSSITIDSSGNVGVGKTNPSTNLDVSGNINLSGIISGSGANLISLNATNITSGVLSANRGGTGGTTLTAGSLLVGNGTSTILQPTNLFWDNSNSRLGIGTASPTSKLHIIHNSTSTIGDAGILLQNTSNTVNNNSLILNKIAGSTANKVIYSMDVNDAYGWSMYLQGNDTTNKTLRFNSAWNATTGNDRMVINGANGNVGIGIDNPSQKLEVGGVLKIGGTPTPTNDNLGVYIWNQANVGPTIAGASFEVRTGGDNVRLRINSTGNVGIGTTNPVYKCHIKTTYDQIATGLHLEASDSTTDPNQYALTLYAYVVGGSQVGWRFRTQSVTGGARTALGFRHDGTVDITGTLNSGATNINGDLFITSSRLVLRGVSPTLYLRDTDHRSGMIHMNSNVMYFLNGSGNDSETWAVQNGQNWCLQLNMTNNNAMFGGDVTAISFSGSGASLTTLNASNISSGTLIVGRGGTGATTLTSGQLLIGNGTGALLQSANLVWDNTNNRIGIGTTVPLASLDIVKEIVSGTTTDLLNMRFDANWGLKLQEHYAGAYNIQYNFIHRYNSVDYNSLTFKGANVGIGTTNPQRPLHVQSAIRIGGTGASLDFGDDLTTQIYRSGTLQEMRFSTNTTDRLRITSAGVVGIQNPTTSHAIPNNYMAAGSLALGNTNQNYGGGVAGWNNNTAGLIMECLDNTEIMVHDGSIALHSFMYYTTTGNFQIGRNAGFGVANVSFGGNVSIGKTSASTALDVNGTVTSTGLLCSGGAIVIDISNNVNIDSGLLYIDGSNNNVGIGTTQPTKKLHVTGDTRIEGNLTVNGTLTQINTNVGTTEQLNITNDGTGPALIVNQTGAQPIIEIQDDGDACFKIFDGGNLGIGTATKVVNVDISGNIILSGSVTGTSFAGSGASLTLLNANSISSGTLVVAQGGTGSTTLAAGQLLIGNTTGALIQSANLVWDNSNNRMSIGKISPDYTLDVSGNINFTGNLSKSGSVYISSQWTTTGSNIYYTTGNIGIGTSTIGEKLTIASNGGRQMMITSTQTLYSSFMGFSNTANDSLAYIGVDGVGLTNIVYGALTLGTWKDKPILFTTGSTNTEKMRIQSNGNVGIGKINPVTTLDVNGTVTATGLLCSGGAIIIDTLNNVNIDSGVLYINGTNNNIGINTTTNISSKLTINNINMNGFDHSESPLTITHPTPTSTSALNDPKTLLHLCRQGTNEQAYGAKASFKLCRWQVNGTNSRTRLDINLSHNQYDDVNIMSLRSDGFVGIGITNPTTTLDVNGTITSTGLLCSGGAIIIDTSNNVNIDSGVLYINGTNNNIGINTTTNIQSKLTINNIVIDRSTFDHSESPLTITYPTPTSRTVLNDPKNVLHLCRQGTNNEAFGAKASFKLCRWENNVLNSRTRLDINLSHGSYDDVNIMSLKSDGSVGIGKTNPTTALDVNGQITCTGALNINTGSINATGTTGPFAIDPNYTTNSYVKIWDGLDIVGWANISGNVGIGKTIPTTILDVNGTITATLFAGSGASITSLNANSISSGTLAVARGGIGIGTLTSGQLLVGNGTNALLQSANLIWDNTNNRLGIGKANPDTTLDINGTITSTGLLCSGGAIVIDTSNNVNIDSGVLYIDGSNNNVGIGTTQPNKKLHVTGDTRIEGNLIVNGTLTQINTNVGTTEQLLITNDGTGPALIVNQTGAQPIIEIQDDGAACFKIFDGGNLGIGTATKVVSVDISGNLKVSGTITGTSFAGNGANLTTLNASNISSGTLSVTQGGTGSATLVAGQLLIGNGTNTLIQSSNLVWDNANNRLGIGKTNPVYPLDVSGNINFTGDLYKSGQLYISSQWTTTGSNIYYNTGSVSVGTTDASTYKLNIAGSVNATDYKINGIPLLLNLQQGMTVQTKHLTYTQMDVKNNTGWEPINDDLATGFVIAITPVSSTSKVLVNMIAHIGTNTLSQVNDSRWWGIKLYRKIGTGTWTEVTGANGTETGAAAATAGTPVWIAHNVGMLDSINSYLLINITGAYLDTPNTTSIVYYTAYWNQKIGDNPSVAGNIFINRSSMQEDAYRSAPSSSWTATEIWDSGTTYTPPSTDGTITIASGSVAIGTTPNTTYKLNINQGTSSAITCFPLKISAGGVENFGNGTATLIGLATENAIWAKCAIGHCRTAPHDVGSIVFLCNNSIDNTNVSMANERMRITSAGNVGIGTTSPGYSLDVVNGGAYIAGFRNVALSSGIGISSDTIAAIGSTATQNITLASKSTGNIILQTNATTRFIVNGNGDIGLGTPSPVYKCHVKLDFMDVTSALHLDASDESNPNKYALTIHPYIIAPAEIGWKFKTQNYVGGTNIPLTLLNNGNIIVAGIVTATSFAGSGASLTLLNANSISSGTLAVARGGTGAATLTSGQLLIGNGTSALLQSANLVWDNTNNRLGIGKTNPTTALDVNGTITSTRLLCSGGAIVIDISNNVNIDSGVLYVDGSNNNVGIGTTQPNNKLHVTGDTRIEGNLIVNGTLTQINTNVGTTEQLLITNDGTGPALIVNQTGAQPIIEIQDDGVACFKIFDGGNLGIGTATKVVTVDISGNLKLSGTVTGTSFTGSGAGLTTLNASNISSGTLSVAQGGTGSTSLTSGQLLVGNGTGALLQSSNLAWNNANNRLDIQGTNPTIKLFDINGDGNAIIAFKELSDNYGYDIAYIGNTDNKFYIRGYNNSATPRIDMTFDRASGNIGIGTTNPTTAKLVISGTAGTTGFDMSSSDQYAEMRVIRNSLWTDKDMFIQYGAGSGSKLRLFSNNIETMVLSNSCVGIGKTNPSTALDVVGTTTSTLFSGSGASLTALNASNISSGTLSVGQGGTGSTTLVATQILVGNGTNALIQSANLVWDNANNRLGIGNTNPAYPLDVIGNINFTGDLYKSGQLYISSQWTTSSTNIYYNTGNVIIGTTTNSSEDGNPSFALPDAKLYVRGTATAGATTDIVFRGGLEGNNNGKVKIWLANDAGHSSYIQSEHTTGGNTQLTFGTATSNVLPVERMRIDNTGNVGIAKTNPGTTLDVNGTITGTLFSGSGANLTTLNATNISSGTLAVARGGTGAVTLTVNQLLVGNGTNALIQSANLSWNNTSNILTATNFAGSGTALTALNASNISSGTLAVANGGTGCTSLNTSFFDTSGGVLSLKSLGSSQWTSLNNNIYFNTANVGIGITNPSYKLHVEDGIAFIGNSPYLNNLSSNIANNYYLLFDNTYNGTIGSGIPANKIRLMNDTSNNILAGFGMENNCVTYHSGSLGSHTFYSGTSSTNYGTGRFQIDQLGNITCTGDIAAFTSISDQRLKTNIIKLDSSIDIIKKLNPVKFNWKHNDFIIENKQGSEDVGFIAQEIEKVIPLAAGEYKVINSEETYKNIKYERIIPYLVKSMQELLEKVEKLEEEIVYLKSLS